MKNIANQDNFYMATKANFKECETPAREADYCSESGSQYWYTEKGVIRQSDHWCNNIRSCSWKLNGEDCKELKSGFCKWEDFELKNLVVEFFEYSVENYNYSNTREASFNITFDMLCNGRIKCFDYDIDFNICFASTKSIHKDYEYVKIRMYYL